VEPKIDVKHNSLVYQKSLPEKNPFHLVPIPTKKMSPHTYVIWVAFVLTPRLGLWEYAGNFIIFFFLRS